MDRHHEWGVAAEVRKNTLIETLIEDVYALPGLDEVRAVDVRVGPFWTVVQTTVGAGIASTMAGEARPHEGVPVRRAGTLHRMETRELVELVRSDSITEKAVGLATINALLGVPRGRVTEEKALTLLERKCRDRRAAMIGRFPFAERLRQSCGELWVFERDHRLGPRDHSAEELPTLLPQAEVVAVTATAVLNNTIDTIMPHIAPGSWTMMLGPSTPMCPALLGCGFDVLCGTVVDDVEAVLAAASQGGVTKQIGGVRRLCLWR
jgi:uncharacterized protein (DUF4213/DUF364 family)